MRFPVILETVDQKHGARKDLSTFDGPATLVRSESCCVNVLSPDGSAALPALRQIPHLKTPKLCGLTTLMIEALTMPQLRPDHPTEKFRIEAAGGTVTMEAAVHCLGS